MRWIDKMAMRTAAADELPKEASVSGDRKLDPAEAYFYLMDRITSMHIVVLVERAAPWRDELVRDALDHVQKTDGLLRKAIHLSDDGTNLCFVDAPHKPIPFASIATESDEWTPSIERELKRRFDPGEAPLLRCLQLHAQQNGRACLVLSVHHAICDGRAAASLAKRLIDYMAWRDGAAALSEEPLPQPAAMHSAFPAAFRWAENPGAYRKAASAILRDTALEGLPSDLPWLGKGAAGEKTPRYRRITLDGADLRALRSKICAHDASLYGVLGAAQLLSQYRLLNASETRRLLLTTPVDMRQHVDCAVGTDPTQLYASMVHATYQVGPASNVWELARDIIARTRTQLARGDGHFFYSASDVAAALKVPDKPAVFSNMIARIPHGSVMSVLGRVPTIASDPQVDAIGFVVCSARHHALFSVASTFRDTLAIDVGYDDGNLADGAGDALVAGMRDAIFAAVQANT